MALQGFDENFYLGQKLTALQASNPEWSNKTTADLKAALAAVGLTPDQHYSLYGWKEGLTPNQFFNPAEYIAAKATALVQAGQFATVEEATAAFNAAWTDNSYTHYLMFSAQEKLNPSNTFDESIYLNDVLNAAKSVGAAPPEMTVDQARDFFVQNGLTVIGHYMQYGAAAGLHATTVPVAEQVHPYAQQTYALSAGASSYNEGTTAAFTLKTTNVSDGTVVNYTVSGVSAGDLTDGLLTGKATVSGGTAAINLGIKSDYLTEGAETLKITIDGANASATAVINDTSVTDSGGYEPPVVPPVNPPVTTPTYLITPGAGTYNEGSTAVFKIATTNVADGTVLNYTLSGTGITAADVTGGSLTGSVTITGNAGVANVALANDATTEGTESMIFSLNGTGQTAAVSIADTSTAASGVSVDVKDANTAPYDASATNVAFNVYSGNYTYGISGFGSGDRIGFPVENAPTVINDNYSDGTVDLQWAYSGNIVTMHLTGLSAANDSAINFVSDFDTIFGAGTIVSGPVTPPVTPTYALAAASTSYNEGSTAVFNLTTTNVADGTVVNYTISGTGITAADTTAGSLTGTATVNSNKATINIALANDNATEGAETLKVTVNTVSATTTVNDTSVAGPAVTVPVSAGNTTPYDASSSDVTFNISSGNYTYNVAGFGSGDKFVFPATNTPTVVNDSYTDGVVDLQWAYSGNVVTVHLTGIPASNDAAINFISDFNTIYGAGTIS